MKGGEEVKKRWITKGNSRVSTRACRTSPGEGPKAADAVIGAVVKCPCSSTIDDPTCNMTPSTPCRFTSTGDASEIEACMVTTATTVQMGAATRRSPQRN